MSVVAHNGFYGLANEGSLRLPVKNYVIQICYTPRVSIHKNEKRLFYETASFRFYPVKI